MSTNSSAAAGALMSRLLAPFTRRRRTPHLDDLDPHLMRDIGLDGGSVRPAPRRSRWDAPSHWTL